MPFIGNQPALSYTSFAKQDFTVTATTSYSLDHPVANANELALFINFVRQEPTTSYSASGTTLTLTESTSVGDDMYCVYLGKAVQTVNPPNASVGLSQLTASGTKNSTTFLRGDNTFATPTDNGKVLQVLFNNSNATVSTTSQSYVTSNQSLSITPSSTSSKILILFNCTVSTLAANTGIEIEIRRGGSSISDFVTGMYTAQVGGNLTTMGGTSFLDTPNTTSATTYEVFFKETALAGTVNLSKRRLHLMEIGA